MADLPNLVEESHELSSTMPETPTATVNFCSSFSKNPELTQVLHSSPTPQPKTQPELQYLSYSRPSQSPKPEEIDNGCVSVTIENNCAVQNDAGSGVQNVNAQVQSSESGNFETKDGWKTMLTENNNESAVEKHGNSNSKEPAISTVPQCVDSLAFQPSLQNIELQPSASEISIDESLGNSVDLPQLPSQNPAAPSFGNPPSEDEVDVEWVTDAKPVITTFYGQTSNENADEPNSSAEENTAVASHDASRVVTTFFSQSNPEENQTENYDKEIQTTVFADESTDENADPFPTTDHGDFEWVTSGAVVHRTIMDDSQVLEDNSQVPIEHLAAPGDKTQVSGGQAQASRDPSQSSELPDQLLGDHSQVPTEHYETPIHDTDVSGYQAQAPRGPSEVPGDQIQIPNEHLDAYRDDTHISSDHEKSARESSVTTGDYVPVAGTSKNDVMVTTTDADHSSFKANTSTFDFNNKESESASEVEWITDAKPFIHTFDNEISQMNEEDLTATNETSMSVTNGNVMTTVFSTKTPEPTENTEQEVDIKTTYFSDEKTPDYPPDAFPTTEHGDFEWVSRTPSVHHTHIGHDSLRDDPLATKEECQPDTQPAMTDAGSTNREAEATTTTCSESNHAVQSSSSKNKETSNTEISDFIKPTIEPSVVQGEEISADSCRKTAPTAKQPPISDQNVCSKEPKANTEKPERPGTPEGREPIVWINESAPTNNSTVPQGILKKEDGSDIQWIVEKAEADSTSELDISEYERKVANTTAETKALVGKLEETSNKISTSHDAISKEIASERESLNIDVLKTIEDEQQLPPPPELPSGGLPQNVESVLIGQGVLSAPTGSVVLPTGLVLVTDEVAGVLLFDIEGNVKHKIHNADWLRPRSPVYHKEHVLIIVDIKEEGEKVRTIIKFNSNMQYVAKIEGPKWMRDATVISERLSIAYTDYLYLSVHGEIFSAIFELSPVGQWTELDYRLSESYVDMLAFTTIGPITQLLIVEGRKNYVLQVSVHASRIVDRRRIALCERPGALARDEAGRLFVANRSSACIQMVDTIQWISSKNVAITDAMVPHFSANWGLLAVPIKGAIRLQRYSFR